MVWCDETGVDLVHFPPPPPNSPVDTNRTDAEHGAETSGSTERRNHLAEGVVLREIRRSHERTCNYIEIGPNLPRKNCYSSSFFAGSMVFIRSLNIILARLYRSHWRGQPPWSRQGPRPRDWRWRYCSAFEESMINKSRHNYCTYHARVFSYNVGEEKSVPLSSAVELFINSSSWFIIIAVIIWSAGFF